MTFFDPYAASQPVPFSQLAQQAWDIHDLTDKSRSAFQTPQRERTFSFGGPSLPGSQPSAPSYEQVAQAEQNGFALAQESFSFNPPPLQHAFTFGGSQRPGFVPSAPAFFSQPQPFQAPQVIGIDLPVSDGSEHLFKLATNVSSILELWPAHNGLQPAPFVRRVSRSVSDSDLLFKDKKKVEVIFKWSKAPGGKILECATNLKKFLDHKFSDKFRDKVSKIEFIAINLNATQSREVASKFENVRSLAFSNCDFFDDSFKSFTTLEKVAKLRMTNCRVRKAHFIGLSKMFDLNRLRFFGCSFARDIEKAHVDSLFAKNNLQEFEAFDCHFEKPEISTVIKFKGSQETEIKIW